MKIAAHQPVFLPWLGLMNKLQACDKFVLLAGVPVSTSEVSRAKFNKSWMTLTVTHDCPSHRATATDMRIGSARQLASVTKTLSQHFASKKMMFGHRARPIIDRLERVKEGDWLLELNIDLLDLLAQMIGWSGTFVVDSSRGDTALTRTKRLVGTLSNYATGPYEYLSGRGALDYLDASDFPSDIKVLVQSVAPSTPEDTALLTYVTNVSPGQSTEGAATWEPWP